ncbi:MAG: alpha/beta fold hydrolase [Bryobacterales bacterium]|nr:alpha/beta fold hydrolase [Bryobacterales bacterium]
MTWLAVGIGAVVLLVLLVALVLAEGILHVRQECRIAPDNTAAALLKGNFQEVSIQAADGLALRAWYFPAKADQRTVCVLHGFTDSRSGMLDHIRLFLELGYGVLAPDSRGHGTSDGNLVTFGEREADDACLWAHWLRGRRNGASPVAFGQSMGAAVALLSAPKARWAAVIAEAGFTRFAEVAAEKVADRFGLPHGLGRLAMWPTAWVGMVYARARYGVVLNGPAPVDVIGKLSMPVLLIHGVRDASIRVKHSRALMQAAAGKAELYEVAEGGHTDSVMVDPHYRERVSRFLTARRAVGRE